jgi:hypothetical protein
LKPSSWPSTTSSQWRHQAYSISTLRRVAGSNRRAAAAKLFEPTSMVWVAWCSSAGFAHAGTRSSIRPAVALAEPITPGTPAPGMGAGADQVQVRQFGVAVVRAEPGALRQDRLQREGRAEVGVQVSRKSCGVKMRLVTSWLRRPGM